MRGESSILLLRFWKPRRGFFIKPRERRAAPHIQRNRLSPVSLIDYEFRRAKVSLHSFLYEGTKNELRRLLTLVLFGEELGENLSQGGELLRSPFGVPALTFYPSGGEIVSASQF